MSVGNLTGGQVQTVLDHFIYEAIKPLIRYSDIFDVQLVYLLGYASTNKKRKLSAHDRLLFISQLCQALSEQDRQKKINIIAGAKIERGFVYNFVVNFLKSVESYPDLYITYLTTSDAGEKFRAGKRLEVMERVSGISRDRMLSVINYAKDNLELAYEFRNKIVQQYIKQAYKTARNHVADKGDTFDFKDVSQNLLAAITKAVDKYDCGRGALTSYINFWILNALTYNSSSQEYGTAFTISAQQRRKLATGESHNGNYAVSLDKTYGEDGSDLKDMLAGDPGVDHELEKAQSLHLIQYLAKRADVRGLARLYLDIGEVFTKREVARMERQMKREGLHVESVK